MKLTCSDLFSLWTKYYGANYSIETFPAVLLYRNIASRYFIYYIKKKKIPAKIGNRLWVRANTRYAS